MLTAVHVLSIQEVNTNLNCLPKYIGNSCKSVISCMKHRMYSTKRVMAVQIAGTLELRYISHRM